jgi:phosphotransferase family enzyme
MTGEVPPSAQRRLPHGYTNVTERLRGAVRKFYQGPEPRSRRQVEQAALTGLHGRFPVPRLLYSRETELCVVDVVGRHGQDALDDHDSGVAGAVLTVCGTLRRQLSEIGPGAVPGLPGSGPVIVHGDFGPQNLLVTPDGGTAVAVFDWEWAHLGDPVEDLAWAEWIVRMHHPAVVSLLDNLFAGYGERPPWSQRKAAMLEACQRMLEFGRRWGDPNAVLLWNNRISVTESFTE